MKPDYEAIRERIAAARSQPDQHPEPEPEPAPETLTDIGARMFGRGRGTDSESLSEIADRIFHN